MKTRKNTNMKWTKCKDCGLRKYLHREHDCTFMKKDETYCKCCGRFPIKISTVWFDDNGKYCSQVCANIIMKANEK